MRFTCVQDLHNKHYGYEFYLFSRSTQQVLRIRVLLVFKIYTTSIRIRILLVFKIYTTSIKDTCSTCVQDLHNKHYGYKFYLFSRSIQQALPSSSPGHEQSLTPTTAIITDKVRGNIFHYFPNSSVDICTLFS